MAANPMLQAVLLFQHHQTTTPFMPVPSASAAAQASAPAKPREEKKTGDRPPFDNGEDDNGEEDGGNDEKEEGE